MARDEVFVTTKVWNGDHGRERALRACRASLSRLGLENVDLLLIHWPVPSAGRYVATWEGLVDARREGLARSIGVSNFMPEHIASLIDATGVVPAVNQIELHPGFDQAPLREFHAEHGIVTEAWSPLGQGQALHDPAVAAIAAALARTPAQVIIRWHLQLGNVVIPKSVTPVRIAENFDVTDFSLSGEQMSALSAIQGRRIGPDPATFALGA
jgi:2,5-diketo-D-gluconate reductase A